MKLIAICILLSVVCLAFCQNQTENKNDDRSATTETSTAAALTESTPARLGDPAGAVESTSSGGDSSANRPNGGADNSVGSGNIAASGSSEPECSECSLDADHDTDDESTSLRVDANPCEVGECTPYYLCLNGTIITSGEGILDVRLGAEDDTSEERKPCPQFFDTCCSIKSEEPILKTPIVKNERCGIRNLNGAGFQIINERDNEAQFAEFPWMMGILYKAHYDDIVVTLYKCGGSLIHPSVVMTAAHCVLSLTNTSDIVVRAGEWDTQTAGEIFPHQDRVVSEVKIHERYRPGSHFNDIALLFLEKPFEIAENVNTVCLPPQDHVFDHQRCFATGWGKNKFGMAGAYQVILKRVELPVIPRDECQKTLRKSALGRRFILDPSFICAGGESGKDTCQGDGGSPLSCQISPSGSSHQYYQAGMVAWGIGCFDPIPGVYVQVSTFRGWIDHIFAERQLETSYYTA